MLLIAELIGQARAGEPTEQRIFNNLRWLNGIEGNFSFQLNMEPAAAEQHRFGPAAGTLRCSAGGAGPATAAGKDKRHTIVVYHIERTPTEN